MSDFHELKEWIYLLMNKRVKELKHVKVLNLSHHSIKELHPDFSHLSNLRELSLSYNLMKTLTLNLPNLKLLTSRNSRLVTISIDCPNLQKIDLSFSDIENLTLDCPSLETLYLTSNKLKHLDLSRCQKLKVLWISYNKLNYLKLNENNVIQQFKADGNNFTINQSDYLLKFFNKFKFYDYKVIEKTTLYNLL